MMLKCHFLLPVWGEEYIDIFLHYSLPAQLSPKNLGNMQNHQGWVYRIFTRPQEREIICASPAYQSLSQKIHTEIVMPPDMQFISPHPYETFNSCYRYGMERANQDKAACVFLTADQIWADGSFDSILQLGMAGKRAIMIAGPRVSQESFLPEFRSHFLQNDPIRIILPPRKAVEWAMKHLHPWDRSLFWNSNTHGRPASFMFWSAGNDGFLMRCFHLHPILIRPEMYYPELLTTIDAGDFVRIACPDPNTLHVIQDSDEAMYFSIAPNRQSSELLNQPMVDWRGMVRMAIACQLNTYNYFYFQKSVFFHPGEMTSSLQRIDRDSQEMIERIISTLTNPFRCTVYKYTYQFRCFCGRIRTFVNRLCRIILRRIGFVLRAENRKVQ